MSLPQTGGGSRLRGEMQGVVAVWELVVVKKKSRCRRVCQCEVDLPGILAGSAVGVAPVVGKVAGAGGLGVVAVAGRMAAVVRPIAVIAVVAPEIAAVVIVVVHDGHVIDCVLHVISLVLRRPVGCCIR